MSRIRIHLSKGDATRSGTDSGEAAINTSTSNWVDLELATLGQLVDKGGLLGYLAEVSLAALVEAVGVSVVVTAPRDPVASPPKDSALTPSATGTTPPKPPDPVDPAAPVGDNTGYLIAPPPSTSDHSSVIRLDVTPEQVRTLRTNREALAPIERAFDREANAGVHSKPVVNPNTDPASLRVGWVGGTDEHSVFPQTQTVPDTGSNVFNYGLGALYSLANLAKTLNNIPFSIIGGVNKELDRHGIPLEALPFDAAPALLAEQAEYLAARTSSLKLPIPILATGGGFGFVPLRIGGRTASGAIRDNRQAWKDLRDLWSDVYGAEDGGVGPLSKSNLWKIDNGLVPKVDPRWIEWFPEHAKFRGELISQHHVGTIPFTTPLTTSEHYVIHGEGRFRTNRGWIK